MVKIGLLTRSYISGVFIVILSHLFCSCNSLDKRNERHSSRAQFESFYNKEISIPVELLFLNLQTDRDVESDDLFKKRPCIISIIDADCDVCVAKLADWKQFLSVSGDIKVEDLFLILQTANPKYFVDRYKSILNTDLNLILDSGYTLVRSNQIPGEQNFRTFLLDNNNRIKLLGDPTKSPRLTNLYNETFKKLKNEN